MTIRLRGMEEEKEEGISNRCKGKKRMENNRKEEKDGR